MIYKRCIRCGKRLDYSSECSCKKKYKNNSDIYKSDREKKFYKSREWQNVTIQVKRRLKYIDIYSYYMFTTIENGQVVHHIEELEESWDKRLSLSNLIYLTEKNHRTIHNMMKKSDEEKRKIQKLLKDFLERFSYEINGVGGIKKVLE